MRPTLPDDRWRQTHLGELLSEATRRFDARLLAVMAHDEELSLALAHLAGRGVLTAAHVHLTRHLPRQGCGLTELAQRASVTKQAMGKLVDQCCAWDLVRREPDLRDARATRVVFTESGVQWLRAYQRAVTQACTEFESAVSPEVATVIHLGLEAYAS